MISSKIEQLETRLGQDYEELAESKAKKINLRIIYINCKLRYDVINIVLENILYTLILLYVYIKYKVNKK